MSWHNSSASEKPWITPEVDSKFQHHKNYFFSQKPWVLDKKSKFKQENSTKQQNSLSLLTLSANPDSPSLLPASSNTQQLPQRGTVLFRNIILFTYLHWKKTPSGRNDSSCFPKYFCHYCSSLSNTRVQASSMLELFGTLIILCPPSTPNTLQKCSQWCTGAHATVWIQSACRWHMALSVVYNPG